MFRCNRFQIKLQIQKPLIVNLKIRNSQKFQSIVSFIQYFVEIFQEYFSIDAYSKVQSLFSLFHKVGKNDPFHELLSNYR